MVSLAPEDGLEAHESKGRSKHNRRSNNEKTLEIIPLEILKDNSNQKSSKNFIFSKH